MTAAVHAPHGAPSPSPSPSSSLRGEAPRAVVTIEVGEDGVAVVTLDDPSSSVNTITEDFGFQFAAALDKVESDRNVRAAVVISGKPEGFIAGANIEMLKGIKFAADAERLAIDTAASLGRIRKGKKPVVAAVHGAALGGGFEVALACHAIVMSNDRKSVVGLPEIKLGLIPGANGLLRVAERAGLQAALDLGLTGKNVRAARARSLGLVDEVCPASILEEVARRRALALAGVPGGARPSSIVAPRRKVAHTLSTGATRKLRDMALEANPLGRAILFRQARKATLARTHGHYPAALRVLDVLEQYGKRGFESAAELEARAFGELVVSETAHRLVEIFFATTALKKDPGTDEPGVKVALPSRVGLLGGGLMGGGIAYVTASAGIAVRLKERDDAGVGRGLAYVKAQLDERVRSRQITPLERDQTLARVTGGTDYSGFRNADIVVEAVFEDLALKQAILRDVEAATRPGCVFASNTSSLPIGKIAAAASRPEAVVGMHYFSPVPKMPLLEVIRTDKTAPWALATAVALGKKQGKTVIVVKDGVGFYTSRILAPYLNEAAYLLSEGVPVDVVDAAMVDWGFPVGPFQLLDEVGLDVAAHVAEIVHSAFGERLTPPSVLARVLADGRKGRKNRRGFYTYEATARRGARRPVDASIYALLGVEPKTRLPVEEIQMRCALQMVNEALLCFGEGTLRCARDGDIGAIMGLGFPPFRGGPFRYVDTLGAAEILRRMQGYHDRLGRRWAPAPILVEKARRGERFHP